MMKCVAAGCVLALSLACFAEEPAGPAAGQEDAQTLIARHRDGMGERSAAFEAMMQERMAGMEDMKALWEQAAAGNQAECGAGPGRLFFEVRYMPGFVDMYEDDDNSQTDESEIKNHCFSVMAGYGF